ncbi:XRE family transcriptional regulator [uncultured Psychrobacter sp.]|uniref:LexA family transcriptional regulator n=1 Tax=uncultured Psychrobacter sp. TaxID=259303 RepID=UPI0026039153|nr:XRE family transcriptional regulator [uncultured Psychrobacter sp.]
MSELEIKHPEFARRLTDLMSDRDIDKNTLSNKTGISYEMIRRYCEGLAKPRSKGLEKISSALGTTAPYLEYGGQFGKKMSVAELMEKIHDIQSPKSVDEPDEGAPADTKKISFSKSTDSQVPVISWVAAGSFSDVMPVTIDDVIDWIPRPAHLSPRAFGLIIQGRSMWPEFKPDEIIYVEPEITPWDLKDGDLIVVHCNDDKQATFKQLVIGDSQDEMYLKPLNPDWPDQKMIPMGECMLVGIVDSKHTRYR